MSDTIITIKAAASSDARRILAIQKAAFARYVGLLHREQIPPLNETVRDLMNDMAVKSVLLAKYEQSAAGSVRYAMRGGVCHIERLSMHPSLQSRGIGKALLDAVERETAGKAHKLYLETGLVSDNLVRFYTRLGFRAEARLMSHYGNFDWIAFSKFPGTIRRTAATDHAALARIRGAIDAVDQTIVCLLAARGGHVKQAAQFRNTAEDIRRESRIEEVLQNVRRAARNHHADPDIIEGIYRTVIELFIRTEMKEYAQIAGMKAGRHV